MKTNAFSLLTRERKGMVVLMAGLLPFGSWAATNAMRNIRVIPHTVVPIHTNISPGIPRTTIHGSSVRVAIPFTNASFLIREGSTFRPAQPVLSSATNRTFEVKTNAAYVIRRPTVTRSLSTNATPFSSEIGMRVGDHDITGTVAIRLASEELEYDHASHQYGGNVVFCFRSDAKPEMAQKLLPLTLRLFHSAGLHVANDTVEITHSGVGGCQNVRLTCDSPRPDASITAVSDALGDQALTIDFESIPFWERFQYPLLLLAGTALGGMGGLIRLWQNPRARKGWRRVIEGCFCGLVTVLLGDILVKSVFHVNTPTTGSVIVGLAGMIGYFGAKFFERFNPAQSATKPEAAN